MLSLWMIGAHTFFVLNDLVCTENPNPILMVLNS